MKPLPHNADLFAVAPRIIWFESPGEALADPVRFLAYLMTYGTAEDVTIVRRHIDADAFREAVERAPAGIMDARSWAYWNIVAGKDIVPPMPTRTFPNE